MRTMAMVGVMSLAFVAPATAEVVVQNDSFVSGQAVAFQAGFVTGEQGAVRLVPTGTAPFEVRKVVLLFGGATASKTVTLRIFEDPGGSSVPGREVFAGDYELTGSNSAFNAIDLSGEGVTVPGAFRVSIEFQHDGVPSIARDTDGTIATTMNFIDAVGLGWFPSNLFGLVGDWVIRAEVVDASSPPPADPPPDAGDDPPPDAGDDPPPDVGDDPPDGTPSPGPEPADDSCALNSDCPDGQHCGDDGLCSFECRLDLDCPSATTCNEVGACVESPGGGCSAGGRSGGQGFALVVICGLLWVRRRRRTATRPMD